MSQESASTSKAPVMSAEEKLHVAQFYADCREIIEGKFTSVSRTTEDPKKKAFQRVADELTAMGVAVRTPKQVQQKINDLKKRARTLISEEKQAINGTGGGRKRTLVMSPATRLMIDTFESSDAVHGIEGAIDSNDPASLERARRLLFEEEEEEEDVISSANILSPASVVSRDNVFDESVEEVEGADQAPKTPLKKRFRRDQRTKFGSSSSSHLDELRAQLLLEEMEKSRAQKDLAVWQLKVAKLQFVTLRQNMTPAEVYEAEHLEAANEDSFLRARVACGLPEPSRGSRTRRKKVSRNPGTGHAYPGYTRRLPGVSRNRPQIIAPQPPVFNGQPADYPLWKAHFSKVLHLGKYVSDFDKSAVLLCALDITVQRTVMALISPTTLEDATYKEMIDALDNHYKVTPIALAEYFKLFSARQSTGQSYPEYAVHIRSLASSCTWPILLNRALAIIFVMGIQDDRLRQQLLQKDHATLDVALEQAKQYASILKESSGSSHRPASSADLNSSVNQVRSKPKDQSGGFGPCDRCTGTNHRSSDCRYQNTVCNACEKVGHLEKACRSKKPPTQQKRAAHRKGKKKEERSSKVNQLVYQLDSIQLVSSNDAEIDNRIYEAELQINGRPARLEVDTGAALTIVSTRLWQEIGSPTLKKSVAVCRSLTGHEVKVRGQADVNVEYNGKVARLTMLVTDTNQNLMGRPWIRALAIHDISKLYNPGGLQSDINLVRDKSSIDHLLREFPSVFESGLGHCTKAKAHLELKENVRPTFIRPRPLPFAVYDSTTAEI
uniref:Regulatory protein zeste n=1 Tax=Plectus sambesii TaxID=2011161 RepID=A0A914X0H5_9BILA